MKVTYAFLMALALTVGFSKLALAEDSSADGKTQIETSKDQTVDQKADQSADKNEVQKPATKEENQD